MVKDPYSNISRFLPVDEIKTIISDSDIKVVSFDIFDTLLVRPSLVPTDIFCLLDPLFPKAAKKFTQLRSTAEHRMGKSNATLSQIWSFIARTEKLDLSLADKMMSAELELERQLLRPRKDIQEVFQYAAEQGKHIIAVSDMYLPSEFLLSLLHEKGFQAVERVYVSCEEGARKDNGELYKLVLEYEEISEASQLVHIGDNYTSDYREALDQGILAFYVPSIWDIMLGVESWWRDTFSVPYISENPITRILFSFSFLYAYNAGYRPGREPRLDTLEEFTQLYLAPLLVSIALDIINREDIQKEYKKIYFAARDGYLPMIAYQTLAEKASAIPAEYLYVSRSALSYGNYKNFFDFFDHFKPSTAYQLGEFLNCFVLDKNLRDELTSKLSQEDVACDLMNDIICARRILGPFKHELNNYFARQKKLARGYYTNALRSKGNRRLVFDCGYSGSVSSGLMGSCKNLLVDKYYLWQTEENATKDAVNNTKTFCRFHSAPPFGVNLIIEECFSPAEGTHLGFEQRGDRIVEVKERLYISNEMMEELEIIRGTLQKYLGAFSEVFDGLFNGFIFEKEDLFSNIGRKLFLDAPTAGLRLFDHIKFPDVYTRGETETLSGKVQDFFIQSNQYPTPFSGTGFLLEENYSNILSRELLPETRSFRLGIHIHLYNRHLYPEIYGLLKKFPAPFDLYLTVTEKNFIPVAEKIFQVNGLSNLRKLVVLLVDNRGRDVAPWLVDVADFQKDYDLFCHLHGKESTQYTVGVGSAWRDYLFINLLESQAAIDILNLFESNENLGAIFPEPFECIANIYNNNGINLLGTMGEDEIMSELLAQMNFTSRIDMKSVFYSVGTMMWYRPKALKPLFDLGLKSTDFPEEPIGVGGTIAHAIERMPALVVQESGYQAKFFTEYPEHGRSWLKWQLERYECLNTNVAPPTQIGLKGALKIFLHKHIPFLFRECAEINYNRPIGVRGALAAYLSKWLHRLLRV